MDMRQKIEKNEERHQFLTTSKFLKEEP